MAHDGFWRAWRKDIARGVALFSVAVIAGLVAVRACGQMRERFADFSLSSLADLADLSELSNLSKLSGFEFDARPTDSVQAFRWATRLRAGRTVWIRNINGRVTVQRAAGDSLVVTATKLWRHADPAGVTIQAIPSDRGVTVCALWPAREQACGPNGVYTLEGAKGNDVTVRITVALPRGVAVDASTVNGRIAVTGAAAPITAVTVNGELDIATTQGPVTAKTVNGAIEATVAHLPDTGSLAFETVNGSVTAVLPSALNARVEARTVSGRIETDYPLTMTGRLTPRRVSAQIGAGGPTLSLRTVHGSIYLRAGADSLAATPARAPRPLRRPAS